MPLSLYLTAAAAAVVASFVIVGLLRRNSGGAGGYPCIALPPRAASWLMHPLLPGLLRAATVTLFVLAVAAGIWGSQDPYRNIAPTLVWIVWWAGFPLLSAFVGDLWAVINPWRTVFDAADWGCRKVRGRGLGLHLRYPAALGLWPAVILLFAVSWTELVFPSPALPANIARLALAYSALTWAGMGLFGSATWTAHGEVFQVLFSLLARVAPIEVRRGTLALRPWGAGLLDEMPATPSTVAFILLVLSSVLYDGLLATPEWGALEQAIATLWPGVRPVAIRTIGLAAFWGIFLAAFVGVARLMRRLAGAGSTRAMAGGFAFTLVPIAIAYHLAHTLVYLLTQGQYLIPLASDPFGWGWDLFGTAGYRVDIAIVGARFAWYAAVTAIVTGHIAAVYLADVRAHRMLGERGAAWRSQVPLTALMVAYTIVSLSILSEPIVERRAAAQPSGTPAAPVAIPADALVPQPVSGRLLPAGPGRAAAVRLSYRLLGSAFHDGTRTTPADLLYAYSFAYRWGARDDAGAHYDPAIGAATRPMRWRLRAVRVVGSDSVSKSFRVGDVDFIRELFLVDIYADVPPGEAEQDAAFAPPWSTLPWHLVVLMEEAVGRGWAAFSKDEAARRGIAWLDLVRDAALQARLTGLVEEFAREGYRPEVLEPLVTADDARRRWAALAAFHKEYGHFLVTNGPYRLKAWEDGKATLEVFRDLSYPLGVGSYDPYAMPRRGFVTLTERDAQGLLISADIEIVQKFMRDYRLERQAMVAVDAVVLRRAAPECRYAVLDGDDRIVLAGTVAPQDDRRFRIDLDGRVPPGTYTVVAEILVNGNAMRADIARIPVTVGSPP